MTVPDRDQQRVNAGALLWEPSVERKSGANIARYMAWLMRERGRSFDSYHDLWEWSVADLAGFWASIWDYFEVKAQRPYSMVLKGRGMPGARWFADAELNYAEHALRRSDEHPAILSQSEIRPIETVTYGQLLEQVSSVAHGLRRLGIRRGDCVAAYMPNIPETVVAFLATASIGAIWSSCSPEFGTRSVIERLQQIKPAVLFGVDGYQYGGRAYTRLAELAEIREQLPSVKGVVVVPYLEESPQIGGLAGAVLWEELIQSAGGLAFEPVPFDHPLWVLYSSGTTGLPKPIVHGHGGILLEHLKFSSLHLDLTPGDRFFWFTTTGWMMWNLLISGLLLGATVVLYDGSPAHPDMGALWRLAQDTDMTYFGTSAPYIQACVKEGLTPRTDFDLASLRGLGSTGAPLSPDGFQWVYEEVKPDIFLGSVSGGTDVCTAFVGSCPILPVHAGQIQCRCLGARVEAYDRNGRPVTEQVGELVVTEPMPSMPLYLWNDAEGVRYKESYFGTFPGVWRHGDWIKVTDGGSCVIYGRSDATLNRGGVRMGTSEFYRVVEGMSEVQDSLVVDTGHLGAKGRLVLFLELSDGISLDGPLGDRIRDRLRVQLSPRHIPDEMHAIPEVPRTLNGKKLEVPVKRILAGTPPEEAVSLDAMSNPDALRYFARLASRAI